MLTFGLSIMFNLSIYIYYIMYQQLKAKETYPPLSFILAETLTPGLIYQTTSTPIETNTKHGLISAVNKIE